MAEIKRNLPRDVFLHLLAIVTLYWSSVSFVTLVWQYINYFFPDNLNLIYYGGYTSLIRFAVASQMIVFPVFIAVSWYLNLIYGRETAVRESKIRKWLIYLTLFVASLVIIVDLVVVINTFLGGEIKIRFALKALSVLAVACLVFGYYITDVIKNSPTKSAKYFAWGSVALVLAAVVGAFFIIGSPATARLIQYDQQKVADLSGIQSQIVNYWQRKESLPGKLSDMDDPISSYKVPNDPQTGQSYEYVVKDQESLSFRLCANFNKPSPQESQPAAKGMQSAIYREGGIYDSNWKHSIGRVCFDRQIDKKLYPPIDKIK